MSFGDLLNDVSKPWAKIFTEQATCNSGMFLPYIGNAACLCCVGNEIQATTFPGSSIGPTTPTTFPAGSIIFSNGTTLADDVANFSYDYLGTVLKVPTISQTVSTVGSGNSSQLLVNLNTTTATPASAFNFALANNSVFCATVNIALVDKTDSANNCGNISYQVLASVNGSGTVTVATLGNYLGMLNSNVSTASSTATGAMSNAISINVVGISGKSIDWLVSVKTLTQT